MVGTQLFHAMTSIFLLGKEGRRKLPVALGGPGVSNGRTLSTIRATKSNLISALVCREVNLSTCPVEFEHI